LGIFVTGNLCTGTISQIDPNNRVVSGLAFVEEEMQAERAALCGPRYAHLAQRSGHVPSSLVMGGRRVKVERPRARSVPLK
jgi:hypothetical protein